MLSKRVGFGFDSSAKRRQTDGRTGNDARRNSRTWYRVAVELDDDAVRLRLERRERDAVLRRRAVGVDEVGRRVGVGRDGDLEVADASATSIDCDQHTHTYTRTAGGLAQ